MATATPEPFFLFFRKTNDARAKRKITESSGFSSRSRSDKTQLTRIKEEEGVGREEEGRKVRVAVRDI